MSRQAASVTAPATRLTGSGPGLIWRLAWPTVTHTLAFNLVQLWALKMVGPLGASAIAATSTGQRLTFMAQGLLMAIAAGTAAMVARHWGRGDRPEAGRIAALSVYLGLFVGTTTGALVWLIAPGIARLFLQEEQAIQDTTLFLRVFAPWMVALALNLILSTALRACGAVILPLISALVMAAVNIPLVYAWTQGVWGFALRGIEGVALAGGIGLAAGTGFLLIVWFAHLSSLPVVLKVPLFHPRTQTLLRLGWPAAAEQMVLHGGLNLFVLIVGTYGTAPYAAYGVGVSILALSFLVGFGFSLAGATLVGQAMGARQPRQAFQHGWQTMYMAIGCMTVLGALIIVFARQITVLMELDPEVADMTVIFIYFLGSMQPLMAIEFSIGGSLRGAGDTRTPLAITLVGLMLVRLGLALIALFIGLGVEWIFASLLVDYCVKAFLYIRQFRALHWLKIRIYEAEDKPSALVQPAAPNRSGGR